MTPLGPKARAEAQRILNRAARRLLDERLNKKTDRHPGEWLRRLSSRGGSEETV